MAAGGVNFDFHIISIICFYRARGMKVRLWFRSRLCSALLPLVVCVLFQGSVTAEVMPRNNGFLFALEKDGHVSYLLGTIHTGFSAEQNLGENIIGALKVARKLYVEADISDSQGVSQKIEANGFTQAPLLRATIGPVNYDFYHRILVERANFFSEDEYAHAKPWLITMVMPIYDPLQDEPPHLQFGSELQLLPFAKEHRIPIGELEGLEAQLKAFDTGTSAAAGTVFDAYAKLVKTHVIYGIVRDEVLAWTAADMGALERTVARRRALNDPYSSFYNVNILKNRSRSMAAAISSISNKEAGVFFAIGAEHLVGPDGVLRALSEKGFRLRRL
jgi:uncharacterized protein YbaP (TraB family)